MGKNAISQRLREDVKTAMKARDKTRVTVLRMLINSLKNAEIEDREALSEEQEIAVLSSYGRRVRESIAGFEQGKRDDLVAEARAELDIVMEYLPEQAGEDEIRTEAARLAGELGASSPGDMGRLMGAMMQKYKGRADGGVVRRIVSEVLSTGTGE